MKSTRRNRRMIYALTFVIILITEIIIALCIRDRFIRPYGGDILVTVLLCCFVRIFFPKGISFLPLWVFLFAAAVEIGQYFDFVSLLGLESSPFFRVLLGSTFSFADLFCYGVGSLLFFSGDKLCFRKEAK